MCSSDLMAWILTRLDRAPHDGLNGQGPWQQFTRIVRVFRAESRPWAVVLAIDPLRFNRLVHEVVQGFCKAGTFSGCTLTDAHIAALALKNQAVPRPPQPINFGSSNPVRAFQAANPGWRARDSSLRRMLGTNTPNQNPANTSHGCQCIATRAKEA